MMSEKKRSHCAISSSLSSTASLPLREKAPTFLDLFNHHLAIILVGEEQVINSFDHAMSAVKENDGTNMSDNDEPVRIYWRTPILLSNYRRRRFHSNTIAYIDITFEYVAPSSASFIGGPWGDSPKGRRVEARFGAMQHRAAESLRAGEYQQVATYHRADPITRTDLTELVKEVDDPEHLAKIVATALSGPSIVLKPPSLEKQQINNKRKEKGVFEKELLDVLKQNREKSSAFRYVGYGWFYLLLSHPRLHGRRRGFGLIQFQQSSSHSTYVNDDVVVPCITAGERISKFEGQLLEMLFANLDKEDRSARLLREKLNIASCLSKGQDKISINHNFFEEWWDTLDNRKTKKKKESITNNTSSVTRY